jgi:diacylglycerol kinase family enzyme
VNPPAPVEFDPLGMAADMAQLQGIRAQADERRRQAVAQRRIQELGQQHADDPDAFVTALSGSLQAKPSQSLQSWPTRGVGRASALRAGAGMRSKPALLRLCVRHPHQTRTGVQEPTALESQLVVEIR